MTEFSWRSTACRSARTFDHRRHMTTRVIKLVLSSDLSNFIDSSMNCGVFNARRLRRAGCVKQRGSRLVQFAMTRQCVNRFALHMAFALWAVVSWSSVQAQIQRSMVNPSFELPFTGVRAASLTPFFSSVNWIAVDAGEIPGWETNHPIVVNGCPAGGGIVPAYTCTPIELWANSYLGVTPAQGIVLAELNAYQLSKLYQNICMNTGESFAFNFAHRGRNGPDQAQFQIGAGNTVILDVTTDAAGTGVINPGGGATGTSATAIANNWRRYAGTYTYLGASGVQPLGFSSIASTGGAGIGNLLDDINIALKPYVEFVGSSGSAVEGGLAAPPKIKVVGRVPAGGLVLTLAVSGTAVLASDYDYLGTTTLTAVSGSSSALSVTVPPGNYSDATANNVFSLPFRVVDDAVIENNKTLLLAMPPNGASSPFVNANTTTCGGAVTSIYTHTIVDNDIDLQTTKTVSPTGVRPIGSTVAYTITFANVTPALLTLAPLTAHDAAAVQVNDAPPSGVSFSAWTCTASGTTCPAASGSGAISQTVNLPVGAKLTYAVQASIDSTALCGQSVVNTSTIATVASSPSAATLTEGTSVQGNAAYVFGPNQAVASTSVQPCAGLSITKSNGVSSLSAGQTTSYAVVVSNAGPSSADGALFKDAAASGLVCTAVTCTAATGAASCASLAAVTPPLMQGSGIVLNNFPASSSYTFTVTCGVNATGVP